MPCQLFCENWKKRLELELERDKIATQNRKIADYSPVVMKNEG